MTYMYNVVHNKVITSSPLGHVGVSCVTIACTITEKMYTE